MRVCPFGRISPLESVALLNATLLLSRRETVITKDGARLLHGRLLMKWQMASL